MGKKYRGVGTIRWLSKDGEDGKPGKDGSNYLIMGWFSNTIQYKLTDAGIPVIKVKEAPPKDFSAYKLIAPQSTLGEFITSEWEEVKSADFIYMQDAYIERLQAVLITAEKIIALDIVHPNGLYSLKDGKLTVQEATVKGHIDATSGTFAGTLDAVTGTFKKLTASGSSGSSEISFSDDKMTFYGDMQHQGQTDGRAQRFLMANTWVRASLGYSSLSAVVIKGFLMYSYDDGLDKPHTGMTTLQSINGVYKIPLFGDGTSSIAPGRPVNLVIFSHQVSNFEYELSNYAGSQVTVVNAADKFNQFLYAHGKRHQLVGGVSLNLINVGSHAIPSTNGLLGGSWLITAWNDSNWA